jgi:hypothetical protein
MLVVGMALGFGIAYEDITSGGIFGQESHITKSVEILSCRQEFVSKRSYPTRDRGPNNRVPSQLELYPLQPCSFDSPILYSLRPLKLASPHQVLSCYPIASLEYELVSPAQVASSQLTSPLFLFSLLVRSVIHKRRTIQKTVNLHVSRMRHSRSQYPAPTGISGDAY